LSGAQGTIDLTNGTGKIYWVEETSWTGEEKKGILASKKAWMSHA